MRWLITVPFIIVGIIHLLPLMGVLGSQRLADLYGLSFDEPNLEILMRHRAVLFGMLGVFLIVAAFTPPLQIPAFIAGLLSIGSFLWLAWSVGGYNPQIGRVVIADIVALICLAVAGAAYVAVQYSDQ